MMVCKPHRNSLKNAKTSLKAYFKDRGTREENDHGDKFV